MKHLSLTRLLPWLSIAVCSPMLNHCGGSAEPGTETGNPPGVEARRLHIVLRDSGVEVVGDAGAVSPGARVRVTNTSSGEQAEATARADGSVSVIVPGSLEDEYDVTVSNGGGSQTVRVSAASNGDSNGTADSDLGSASCEALENTLGQRIADGFSSGNTACRVDDDCVFQGWGAGCYFQCGGSFLSVNGAALAQMAVEEDTAPVCSELESRCTRQPASSCPPPTTTTPECANGVCQGLDLSGFSCEELSNSAAARLGDLIDGAGRSCSVESDCTLYNPGLACAANCGYPIAVATAALLELTGSITRLEDRFCSEFTDRSCPGPFQFPCPAPLMDPRASCVSGQCTLTSTGF